MLKAIITFIILFTLACNQTTLAQTDSIKWSRDTLIQWIDFKGPVDTESEFEANSNLWVNYTYHFRRFKDQFHFTFKVESYFLKNKSWSIPGKQTDDLLVHERLHNDINELFARKLFIALNQQTYTVNYKNEMKVIFERENEAVKEIQIRYDTETRHSKDKVKQAEWQLFIKTQLDTIPPHHY